MNRYETRFADLLQRTGLRICDAYMVTGKFEMLLICEAPDIGPIRQLLRELRGWITTSMLANKHVGRFGMTAEVRRTNWLNPRQTAAAHRIVGEAKNQPPTSLLREVRK
jgi:hypothetical protein